MAEPLGNQTALGADYKVYDFENQVDPENHVFNNLIDNCKYYSDDELNAKIAMDNTFSLIHFNARSMYANFNKMKEYLNKMNGKFKVIALSETWMKQERRTEFPLDGYELYYTNRDNKTGGGVAFFVDRDLRCKVIQNMSILKENLMECITVEIELEKSRNTVITCVYRAPGSNVETFVDSLEDIISRVNDNKTYWICGDLNIDLLSADKHKPTADFLDTLYSRGFHPLITKPSRMTSSLINNIFLNIIDNNISCGLIINDISDHLPVFVIYDCHIKSKGKRKLLQTCEGKIRRSNTQAQK